MFAMADIIKPHADNGKIPDRQQLTNFEMISLQILSRLTMQDDIDEEIIDRLREMGLEYYSLLKKYEIIEARANLDEKTTLLKYNEVFLINIIKAISRYWQSAKKSHVIPISYLRMDLDDFSKVNNLYGHDMGDRVLIEVASLLKKLSRPTDYLFRYGGEEFDIVLPVTDREGAMMYSQKVLEGIRGIAIPMHDGISEIRITASMGISSFEIDFQKLLLIVPDQVMGYYRSAQKEADYACYEAKYLGKNRSCVFEPGKDYESIMRAYGSR